MGFLRDAVANWERYGEAALTHLSRTDPVRYFLLMVAVETLAGTSKFATNEYFPYVSNGELGVATLRWLAADETMPTVQP